ncbi:MAG: alkaline phosphatase family protein [Planctomycetota bacterium]
MVAWLRYIPVVAVLALLPWLTLRDAVRQVAPPRQPAPAADAATIGRFVVLVADGLDERLVRARMGVGELPHLAALAQRGAFHPLLSELPPESPVAMASLQTGVNPGRHRVFDFIARGDDDGPANGMVDVRRARTVLGRVLVRPPVVRSRLSAPTFVDRVHAAGYPVLAHRQPLAWPVAQRPGAFVTGGLGTPDLAASAGFYGVWSSRPDLLPGDTTFGGRRYRLHGPADGHRFTSHLEGPPDPSRGRDDDGTVRVASLPLVVERDVAARTVRIELAGVGTTVEVDADGRGRSNFLPAAFRLGTLPPVTVRGVVRFEVHGIDPLVLVSDPVNMDPRDPPQPLASPPDYGSALWSDYGPYETVGWPEQTFQLNDGWQDDDGFLRDLLQDMDRNEAQLLGELRARAAARLVYATVTATDRALHAFWRDLDPQHPLHDAEQAKLDRAGRVLRRFDDMVGRVVAALGPDDKLLVASDHGFTTWRWSLHLNQWLVNEGLLVLRRPDVAARNLHGFFGDTRHDDVDWSQTKAFAMGLGQIYLNIAGRDARGIVPPGERDALVARIREGLMAVENPLIPPGEDTPPRPVVDVVDLHATFTGPYALDAPDLQVLFDRAWRVSWQTALRGGMSRDGGPLFEQNRMAWSGDHCSCDPAVVPAVLFTSWAVPAAAAGRPWHVRDVAATALAHFGLPTDDLDGQPLPGVR